MGQHLAKNYQLNSRLSSSELDINDFENIINKEEEKILSDNQLFNKNNINIVNEVLPASVSFSEENIGKSLIIKIRMLKMEPIDLSDKLSDINTELPITNTFFNDKKLITTPTTDSTIFNHKCNCQIYNQNCNYCSGINLINSDNIGLAGAVGTSATVTSLKIEEDEEEHYNNNNTTEIINNFNISLNDDNSNETIINNIDIINNNDDNNNDDDDDTNDDDINCKFLSTTKKCKQLNNLNKFNNNNNNNNNKICDSDSSTNQILINHIYNNNIKDNDNEIKLSNIVLDNNDIDRYNHNKTNQQYNLLNNNINNCNLVNNFNINTIINNNNNNNDINMERLNKNSVINNNNNLININNNNNTLLAESNDIFNNSINNNNKNNLLSSTMLQQQIKTSTIAPVDVVAPTIVSSGSTSLSVLSPIIINNHSSGEFLIQNNINNNLTNDTVQPEQQKRLSSQDSILLSNLLFQQQNKTIGLGDLSGATPVISSAQQQSLPPPPAQSCCCCKKKTPLVSLGSSKRSKCKCPTSLSFANQTQSGITSGSSSNSKNPSPAKDAKTGKEVTPASTTGKTKKTNWVVKLGCGKSKNSGKSTTIATPVVANIVNNTTPNTPTQNSSCVCTGYRKVEADTLANINAECASAPLLTQQNPFNFQQQQQKQQFFNPDSPNLGLKTTNLMSTGSLVPVQQIVASSSFASPSPILPIATTASTLFGVNTNLHSTPIATTTATTTTTTLFPDNNNLPVAGNLSSSSSSSSFNNITPATTTTTTTTTLLHSNGQVMQRIETAALYGGSNLFLLMNQTPHPLIDFTRFNSNEYPIDEDQRAREQRAFEIAEGVEPPPSFIAKNQLADVTPATTTLIQQTNPSPMLAQTPVTPTPATGGPHWHMLCAQPDARLHNMLQNRMILPNPDDSPRIHSQVDYIHCLVPDLQKITSCCFYWGKMDRYEAERLLEGKPEGTFLLRDSAQEEFLFSVSFRKYGRSLHARIEQFNHKFSFDSHDPGVYTAPTVTGLLEHYKDPSCVMFFEPTLILPLNRNFCFSLQQLCRATIVSHISYDGINELCLPKSLKSYLKEYHYKQRVRMKIFDEQTYKTS